MQANQANQAGPA